MLSSYSNTLGEMETAMQWIASGRIDVADMITGYTNLAKLQATVAALDDRQIKVIVTPP